MKVIVDDIWNYWKEDNYIIIPTNGFVKSSDKLVMGKGLALQAKERIKDIEEILGKRVKQYGNYPQIIEQYKIISFPVKHAWYENADLKLIEGSATILSNLIKGRNIKIYSSKVGCGNGRLSWSEVEPILEKYLKELIIVDYN